MLRIEWRHNAVRFLWPLLYCLKDGTWKKAKPHWKFQSLGPRGKRRYVHVPAGCVEGTGRKRQAVPGAGERVFALGHGGVDGGRRGKNFILPRPRFRRVEEVVAELRNQVAGRKAGTPGTFAESLKKAVLADAVEYAGEAVSAVERHRAGAGVHSWREGDLFTCMGWTRAQYPYHREAEKRGARWETFGVERKMTSAASDTVSRLAAKQFEQRERGVEAFVPVGEAVGFEPVAAVFLEVVEGGLGDVGELDFGFAGGARGGTALRAPTRRSLTRRGGGR